MENKINVAELLKDCPKGMELDCTMYEDVSFVEIVPNFEYSIRIETKSGFVALLTKYGQNIKRNDAKCVIFPKGKTTWEGFHRPFKDGDILAYTNSHTTTVFIHRNKDNEPEHTTSFYVGYTTGVCHHNFHIYNKSTLIALNGDCDVRLATEEEKEKLFDAIKANGYRWNAETKTLEKLVVPKFKVGDKIRHKVTNKADVYEISKVYDDSYGLVGFTWMLYMKYQDQYELVPNKFDINTLVPFESRVLVRAADNQFWRPAIWGVKHEDWDFYCVIGGEMWEQCIPYEGNEHLLGTTDDCEDFYKTWTES